MLYVAIALFTLPYCLHFAVLCSVLIAGYISYSPAGSNSLPARELHHLSLAGCAISLAGYGSPLSQK